MNRFWIKGVYVEDKGENRKYYATDGHIFLFFSEKIDETDEKLEKPILLFYEKLPKSKNSDYYVFSKVTDNIGVISINGDSCTVSIEDFYMERFEDIKKVLPGDRKLYPMKDYTIFNDDIIKELKNFLGLERFLKRPYSLDTEAQHLGPSYWVFENKIAIAMPMRIHE